MKRTVHCLGIYGSPDKFWGQDRDLRELGVNAVFVGHGSLSQEFIRKCREQGAKVYSELTIFAGKEVAEKHPDLWPIGADGEKMKPDKWYLGLCPTKEWYRKGKLDQMRQILQDYEIDGIWLDFIRFPCHWEVHKPRIEQACFCDSCLDKFSKDMKIKIQGKTPKEKAAWILKNREKEWTKWKCAQITEFCQEAKKIIKETRPKALLGIFSVPWTERNYNDAIHKIIAQDFDQLAKYVDVFSPMVYHKMCGWEVSWIGEYVKYLTKKTKKEVWPIVQATNEPSTVSPEEFEKALRNGLSDGSTGVMVFTFADVLKEKEKEEVLKRVYLGGESKSVMTRPNK